MSSSVLSVISRFLDEYVTSTPNKLKLVDAYLLYIVLTGAMQFLYCLLVGTFPFNSFLSGFISCVGCFILAGKKLVSQRRRRFIPNTPAPWLYLHTGSVIYHYVVRGLYSGRKGLI
ncbi:Dolichyl-diphosphooligosaccharide--protein glycosyltransferase subunit DAD1 [Acipenser ruthenus]|uniref:Dolichyl-diphosphooligosaccharide--protein glycosyltransferase subunit DAD1 n=1 Tax=Acipenser ruthenus TaxID=7906 RepID=A0A444U139_ACIRT|nr:Dolichyl-diphosphooligosaccharide--protein glycosyltransferase subunit DAD1 [Acipenser ruthenus]